ncbi:MAG: DNA polymerase III subunit gamma/tau [Alphaproteobacteria bacterium]
MNDLMSSTEPSETPYRVLARKYRPATFSGLIGQDVMVRTLTNAIRSDRLAHAYLLTGVRGIGKTTTARIIARALNCTGADGDGPTAEPCGECEHCLAIAQDRDVDVIEMDAASRTGVDDIRELIDGVRYRPAAARYKVYIIDEVHMLSNNAFNALLKTLEEPPEHVKFIFATTEVRKLPVTVLSRCQRFDLKRVDAADLADYLATIAKQETMEIDAGALALIGRAADGSVRDGLSLLDQAFAHSIGDGGAITEDQVRDMLGLADRGQIFELFEAVMRGDAAKALELLEDQHRAGADAVLVIQDLLELTHWLTRVKLTPELADDITVPEAERALARTMAERLSMPTLARAWQMLLKGLGEVQTAPAPLQAAEMVLVRLAYAADMPAPAEIVRSLTQKGAETTAGTANAAAPRAQPASPPTAPASGAGPGAGPGQPATALAASTEEAPAPVTESTAPMPASFTDVVELFNAKREAVLHTHLVNDIGLVRFEPGRIEFSPGANAPRNLANRLGEMLSAWTGTRWVVSVAAEPGAPSLAEQKKSADQERLDEAKNHPLVRAALDAFPGAKITEVREGEPAPDGDDAEIPAEDDIPPDNGEPRT